MTDRVYPAAKPAATAAPAATVAGAPNGAAVNPAAKAHLYNPTARLPYRPQPHHRRYRSRRNICCCCCFWTILVILALALLAAIAGAAVYVIYRPQRPTFTVSSFRVRTFNLTTSPDSSSSHLVTLFNVTVTAKNPNAHLVYSYDPFAVAAVSGSVQLANGSFPAITMPENNATTFRVVLSSSQDLDAESASALRSDLKRKSGVPFELHMDTKVNVKIDKMRSKRVGIRVVCDGVKGLLPPKGKSPTVASVADSECKVDLRIKIWIFTF